MPALMTHVCDSTPMGATLIADGATFRVWAPHAKAVYVTGDVNGAGREETLLNHRDGHWVGFIPGVTDRAHYRFWVDGEYDSGPKRDPHAKELDSPDCVVRDADFPWHDTDYRTPDYHDMVLYQLHVGTYHPRDHHHGGTFLDVALRLPYLRDLGISAIQLLPIHEFRTSKSLGYNGTDLYSPETDYAVADADLAGYLAELNALLVRLGHAPYRAEDLTGELNQFKALVDLAHLHGIAVVLDTVYNHAGNPLDEESIRCFDRQTPFNGADMTKSLYFRTGDHTGPVFDFAEPAVRDFLIRNAEYYLRDCRVDGFRYDQVSVIDDLGRPNGWRFCQDLTDTVRAANPRALQIAEYWPVNLPVVARPRDGGAGFDASLTDGLRNALRSVVAEASSPDERPLNMTALGASLWPAGFGGHWQFVQGPENHDLTYAGHNEGGRLARLADPANPRSWYGRSRVRVATGISLTAPGIPMLFMGQEFLEDKPWIDDWERADLRLYWAGLERGDRQMRDHHRFVYELIRLRRSHPGLHGQGFRVTHVHDDNRVLAYHRWADWEGHDVVVVAHLGNSTKRDYRIGFPTGGRWAEVFNSDLYENWVNPDVAGNNGAAYADAAPMHGFGYSASLTLPANSILVFSR